jgi:hypothetical protein
MDRRPPPGQNRSGPGDRPDNRVEGRDKPRWNDRHDRNRPSPPGERRGAAWRPGGSHQDPRDRFKVPRDVKRKRFVARTRRNEAFPKPPRKKKDGDE